MKYSSEIRDRCSSAEHVFNTFIYRRRPIGDKTRLLLVQTEGLLVALWLTTSPQPRQANDLNSLSCELIKPNPPDLVPRHIVARRFFLFLFYFILFWKKRREIWISFRVTFPRQIKRERERESGQFLIVREQIVQRENSLSSNVREQTLGTSCK